MNNIIIAILHIQKASELIKFELPDISDALLQLAFTMTENEKIKQEDILKLSSIVDEIKDNDKNEQISELSCEMKDNNERK